MTLHRGQAVRVHFGSGVVDGEIIEIREEPTGARRVVINSVDEGVELDTDATRVQPVDMVCPACNASWDRKHAYRCPECRVDLVDD